jgi:hypothetical protein
VHNHDYHDPASRPSTRLAWIVATLGVTAATLATGALVAAALDAVPDTREATIGPIESASATTPRAISRPNGLFDPIELAFIIGRSDDSSTEDVLWFLDPVELDFITGRGGWR